MIILKLIVIEHFKNEVNIVCNGWFIINFNTELIQYDSSRVAH